MPSCARPYGTPGTRNVRKQSHFNWIPHYGFSGRWNLEGYRGTGEEGQRPRGRSEQQLMQRRRRRAWSRRRRSRHRRGWTGTSGGRRRLAGRAGPGRGWTSGLTPTAWRLQSPFPDTPRLLPLLLCSCCGRRALLPPLAPRAAAGWLAVGVGWLRCARCFA
jgi:hypothetical protein